RAGHRYGERIRNGEWIGVRRMVLRHPLRKDRRLHQELTDDVRKEGQNADAAAAGRRRQNRSDRPEPAVLPRPEAVRSRDGPGHLSTRAARPAGGKASSGSPEPRRRVVRQVHQSERVADGTVTVDTRNGLRHVVEYAQDLIYYCDLEGYFTYVNPAAARVMGYDEQELVGHHFVHLVHPDYRAMAVEFYKQQIDQATPSTYLEFVAASKDGGLIWIGQHVQLVYEDGHPSGVHGIARDITHQKSIEEKLRRSESRYRSLIQGAAYGIYRSTRAGAILDANPAFAQMLGYGSVSELMTRRM